MLYPYVDTTLSPAIDFTTIPHIDGLHLGFVIADSSKDPSWGGHYKVSSDYMDKRIRNFKKPLICSFGGAAGAELATVCKDEYELFTKYKYVIEKYNFKIIDFDIEGAALGNLPSIEIRNKAIRMLRKAFPKLKIHVTLPVSPNGTTKMRLKGAVIKHSHFKIITPEIMKELVLSKAKGAVSKVATLPQMSFDYKLGYGEESMTTRYFKKIIQFHVKDVKGEFSWDDYRGYPEGFKVE